MLKRLSLESCSCENGKYLASIIDDFRITCNEIIEEPKIVPTNFNGKGTYYYFNDTIKIEDFDPDNIKIDEKSHENILVYNISYKSLIDSKPLRIRFNKIDGFIRVYDEINI